MRGEVRAGPVGNMGLLARTPTSELSQPLEERRCKQYPSCVFMRARVRLPKANGTPPSARQPHLSLYRTPLGYGDPSLLCTGHPLCKAVPAHCAWDITPHRQGDPRSPCMGHPSVGDPAPTAMRRTHGMPLVPHHLFLHCSPTWGASGGARDSGRLRPCPGPVSEGGRTAAPETGALRHSLTACFRSCSSFMSLWHAFNNLNNVLWQISITAVV